MAVRPPDPHGLTAFDSDRPSTGGSVVVLPMRGGSDSSTPAPLPRSRWSRILDAAIDAGAGFAYRLIRNPPDLLLRRLGVATLLRRADFYTLSRIARTMHAVPGAVLECGTHHGATLLGMAHVLRGRGIRAAIYGLDSFEGFPEPTPEDALDDGTMHPMVRKGALNEASIDVLRARIARMGLANQVTVIKGFFKDTLPALQSERFSLVHLDCDLYDSYLSCLEFVYPRMLPGGYIVLDDYGSPVYPGAQRAVDEFFADKRERIQYFPETDGWRYFTFMGGGLAPGAREATTIEWPILRGAA